MKKKWIALLLAVAMLLGALTACGSAPAAENDTEDTPAPQEETEQPQNGDETEPSDAPAEIPAEALEDPIAYVTDGAVKAGDVVMTVDGVDIPAGVYTYWLADQYSSMAYTYMTYGMELDVAEAMDESGATMADYFSQQAETVCQMHAVLKNKALEAGLELTEEQQEDMAQLADSYDENMLTYYATDMTGLAAAYEASCLATNLQDYLYAEDGPEAPTEETLTDYAQETGTYTCRYILFYTADLDEDDADGRAAQLAAAQEIYDQLAACAPEELEETFAQLQAEHNYDGNTEPFTFNDDSSLADGFRETVAAVSEGELALSDETMYGYFVILRLPNDLDTLKEEYVDTAFEAKIAHWVEESEIVTADAYAGLDHVATLQRLQSLQDAVIAAMSAQYAEPETAE